MLAAFLLGMDGVEPAEAWRLIAVARGFRCRTLGSRRSGWPLGGRLGMVGFTWNSDRRTARPPARGPTRPGRLRGTGWPGLPEGQSLPPLRPVEVRTARFASPLAVGTARLRCRVGPNAARLQLPRIPWPCAAIAAQGSRRRTHVRANLARALLDSAAGPGLHWPGQQTAPGSVGSQGP